MDCEASVLQCSAASLPFVTSILPRNSLWDGKRSDGCYYTLACVVLLVSVSPKGRRTGSLPDHSNLGKEMIVLWLVVGPHLFLHPERLLAQPGVPTNHANTKCGRWIGWA